jgi:metal-responsive CopG/Arc/MetJ family transcriptional regulator
MVNGRGGYHPRRGRRLPFFDEVSGGITRVKMRTSIIVKKAVLENADACARRMKISRSRLFSMALEEYIQRQQNRELLEKFNAAYAGDPDPEEQMLLEKYLKIRGELLESEW